MSGLFGWGLDWVRPEWLALLGLSLPWLIWGWRHSLVEFSSRQRLLSTLVRGLMVILLVLALAGLSLTRPTQQTYTVVLWDISLSVEDSRATVNAFLESLETGSLDRCRIIPFAERPFQPMTIAEFRAWKLPEESEGRMGTNIQQALRVAEAIIPPFYVPQVVLFSDGNQTQADVLSAFASGGFAINTRPLASRGEPEVQVSRVSVPAQVKQDEPFLVEATIDANRDTEGRIAVYRDGFKLLEEVQPLKEGSNSFQFRQTIRSGRAEYSVRVTSPLDTILDNNRASGLVYAEGKPRLLLIDGDARSARSFVWGLEEQGLEVDLRPPQASPTQLAELQNYDAVILSNVPATDFQIRQMEVLRTYVQDLGGGLVMLGGDQSFGLGGYFKSTLEEVLPVRCDFEKEREKPSLAMVLLVDKSGSMGGLKIELAKDAAKGTVELLGPRDQIGVVAFDEASYWVSELHSAADKTYVADRIATIEASGGTSIFPAMQEAFTSLSTAVAKLKHVILMTDGRSSPGDFEALASQMAAARITISTVGVGGDADQTLLQNLARIGNGRYYFCDDPRSVPQVFAKETLTASKSAINEEPFLPQLIRPTQVLTEIELEAAPFLLGNVVTRAKPTSEVILATEKGEPLLSWWRYGLGMSVAFTSDTKPRWASEWLAWPDFGKFWAQVIRHAMRKTDASGGDVTIENDPGRARVVLDATDPLGQFRNHCSTTVSVVAPDLQTREYTMEQTAPGRYEVDINTDQPGTYLLNLTQRSQERVVFQQARGLVEGYAEELRIRPANVSLLQQLAARTQGHFSNSPTTPLPSSVRQVNRVDVLWPWLLKAVLLLLVVDVALRRVAWKWLRDHRDGENLSTIKQRGGS